MMRITTQIRILRVLPFVGMLILSGLLFAVWYELEYSRLQAKVFTHITKDVRYVVVKGPSQRIRFPNSAPYDDRMGYSKIPRMVDSLSQQGFVITHQAEISPEFDALSEKGIFNLYDEKDQAGLMMLDRKRHTIHVSQYPKNIWQSFEDVPPILVDIVRYVENREILKEDKPYQNPAIEWKRLTNALRDVGLEKIGIPGRPTGGSTLATQLEKFRHSPEGRTHNTEDKAQQMLSAAMRAYLHGEDTSQWQKRVVLAYVNNVPLAAIEGFGEINGLADGLQFWFGADIPRINALLHAASVGLPNTMDDLIQQAIAVRQVVALVLAHRRPTDLLKTSHARLIEQTDSYIRILTRDGVLSDTLAEAALLVESPVLDRVSIETYDFGNYKLSSALRGHATSMTGAESLYELERLDVTVETTLDMDVQTAVEDLLRTLSDAQTLKDMKVPRFGNGDPADVVYSFTLYERMDNRNVLRVQADTLDQPLNINEHIKLDLGSTAKLRTLATYLTIVDNLHQTLKNLSGEELRALRPDGSDYLTSWVISKMRAQPGISRETLLRESMKRTFSASTHERFFTGGGVHTFSNFKKEDNGRNPTAAQAFQNSINLPFIRIMREVVRHYMFHSAGSSRDILENPDAPERKVYLERFAEMEARQFLKRFETTYEGMDQDMAFRKLFRSRKNWTPKQFLAAYRAVWPDADVFTANMIFQELMCKNLSFKLIKEVYEDVDPAKWNWNDKAYLAKQHPLELWLLQRKVLYPDETESDRIKASKDLRMEIYQWLFKPHQFRAQNIRIRTILEHDAFVEVHKHWQSLGYPFDELVPSFATALGTSADRPDAIAELVGIVLNDGIRFDRTRVQAVHFAAGTPYETRMEYRPNVGRRVMSQTVATVLEDALLSVVEVGTARSLERLKKRDWVLGGKTGTGDHKLVRVNKWGDRTEETPLARSATFAFFLEDRFFGTLTAFVQGEKSGRYTFTSGLPVIIVNHMLPLLDPLVMDPPDLPPLVIDIDDIPIVEEIAPPTTLAPSTVNP